MKFSTIFIGKSGEDAAEKYLKKCGYRIIEKNYKSPYGEIDIVALDKGIISFIEVKYRRSKGFGPPELSVGSKKRLKLTKSAMHFLTRKRIKNTPCRFDVISITEREDSKGHKIEIIKDAFEMERTL